MAPANPGWLERDGRKTWPLTDYAIEGPRTTNWLTEGVVKQHRTLGTTLNALIDSGFTICHVQEWSPTAAEVCSTCCFTEARA